MRRPAFDNSLVLQQVFIYSYRHFTLDLLFLYKCFSLQQGASCLAELEQSPPKPVLESMQPLLHAVVKPELLKHQDREVKLLVAACICEITRITAPEAPYTDDILKVNERQRYHLAPTFFE